MDIRLSGRVVEESSRGWEIVWCGPDFVQMRRRKRLSRIGFVIFFLLPAAAAFFFGNFLWPVAFAGLALVFGDYFSGADELMIFTIDDVLPAPPIPPR